MSAVDRITEALTAAIWDTKRDHLTVAGTRDVIATDVLATVRALIREDGPDGEEAREALGLRVERWHGTYPDQRLISEWESKA